MITVSIVDDEKELRQSITTFVNGSPGFKCFSAYGSAETALKGLPGDKPDVVLMDIDMPGKDGLTLLREIKQRDAGIKTIMLTGMVSMETVLHATRLGAEEFLFKPIKDLKCVGAAVGFSDHDRRIKFQTSSLDEINNGWQMHRSTPGRSPAADGPRGRGVRTFRPARRSSKSRWRATTAYIP